MAASQKSGVERGLELELSTRHYVFGPLKALVTLQSSPWGIPNFRYITVIYRNVRGGSQ